MPVPFCAGMCVGFAKAIVQARVVIPTASAMTRLELKNEAGALEFFRASKRVYAYVSLMRFPAYLLCPLIPQFAY